MNNLKRLIIFIIVCLSVTIPHMQIAQASNVQQQQSTLYPYNSLAIIQDEFLTGAAVNGQVGSLGWNAGGTIASGTSTTNNPGTYLISTGAVSGTIGRINMFGSNVVNFNNNQLATYVYQVNTNDANTTIRIGTSNTWGSSPPASGIYIEKLDADTNWFCITRAGGVETRTDSGIAVNTSFVSTSLIRNSSGVLYTIGGVSVCGTHTTNIPSGLGGYGIQIVNSAAVSKSITVDYFSLEVTVQR